MKQPWIHLPTLMFILFNMAPYAFTLSRLYKLETNQVCIIDSESAFTPSSLVIILNKNVKKDLDLDFVFKPPWGLSI